MITKELHSAGDVMGAASGSQHGPFGIKDLKILFLNGPWLLSTRLMGLYFTLFHCGESCWRSRRTSASGGHAERPRRIAAYARITTCG